MANKNIFSSTNSRFSAADTVNEAGGQAYAFDNKHALAQLAATGCISDTFYVSAEDQLDTVLRLANEVPVEFLAKTAIFSRERGHMKDMPALLLAVLLIRNTVLFKQVFNRVADNGKMIRNFVQIIRSGKVGRKSFGTVAKRMLQQWLENRTDKRLLDDSVGNDPSLADVIRMVHPHPRDTERAAFYGYLIGKKYDNYMIPEVVKQLERFKNDMDEDVPNVSFQLLTALPLQDKHWKAIAENMNWHTLRMNLNTLARHNVFISKSGTENTDMIEMVAKKLENAESVRKARVFPYQLMAAYRFAQHDMPHRILTALQRAMDVAIENIPVFEGKKIWIFTDVSGSMGAPVTGSKQADSKPRQRNWGSTTQITCRDMAAVVTAAFLKRNLDAEAMLFSDHVHNTRLNNNDSIMTTADRIENEPSGGTNCSAPMEELNNRKAKADLIIYVSDNMSWADSDQSYSGGQIGGMAPRTMTEFAKVKARSPGVKLVLIDGAPNTSTQAQERKDIFNIGGFSDVCFEMIDNFVNNRMDKDHWVGEVENIDLSGE